MKYLDRLKNEGRYELSEYTKLIYGGVIPDFIEEFINLKIFQDLDGKGQFCGVNYTNAYNPLCSYSRLDHSINTAGIIWRVTHDKKQTICALVHDLGTPSFAHTIDYLLKDYETQSSSEKNIKEIILNDKGLLSLLKKFSIKVEQIDNPLIYSLVDIERPGLCADRLEGIIHICYIWLQKYTLEDINQIINNICICRNENNQEEIGFSNYEYGKKFFEMVLTYAYELVGSKDTYCMQVIADIINLAIKYNVININDLYIKEEKEIVKLLSYFDIWKKYVMMNKVYVTQEKPDIYSVRLNVKKRYAIPLIKGVNKDVRITWIDEHLNSLLNEFLDYVPTVYAYNPRIRKIGD